MQVRSVISWRNACHSTPFMTVLWCFFYLSHKWLYALSDAISQHYATHRHIHKTTIALCHCLWWWMIKRLAERWRWDRRESRDVKGGRKTGGWEDRRRISVDRWGSWWEVCQMMMIQHGNLSTSGTSLPHPHTDTHTDVLRSPAPTHATVNGLHPSWLELNWDVALERTPTFHQEVEWVLRLIY